MRAIGPAEHAATLTGPHDEPEDTMDDLTSHDDDHDRGLGFDLGTLLSRLFAQKESSGSNLPLVFVYAYAIAKVTGGLELPIGLQRWLADKAGGARPVALPALVSRRPQAAPTPLAAGAA